MKEPRVIMDLNEIYDELEKHKNLSIKMNVENLIKFIYHDLYKTIEHGDEEHRKWLKDAMDTHEEKILNSIKIK